MSLLGGILIVGGVTAFVILVEINRKVPFAGRFPPIFKSNRK